jgi:hypothetical protein
VIRHGCTWRSAGDDSSNGQWIGRCEVHCFLPLSLIVLVDRSAVYYLVKCFTFVCFFVLSFHNIQRCSYHARASMLSLCWDFALFAARWRSTIFLVICLSVNCFVLCPYVIRLKCMRANQETQRIIESRGVVWFSRESVNGRTMTHLPSSVLVRCFRCFPIFFLFPSSKTTY